MANEQPEDLKERLQKVKGLYKDLAREKDLAEELIQERREEAKRSS